MITKANRLRNLAAWHKGFSTSSPLGDEHMDIHNFLNEMADEVEEKPVNEAELVNETLELCRQDKISLSETVLRLSHICDFKDKPEVSKKPIIAQKIFGGEWDVVNAWYQANNVAIINLFQYTNTDIVVYYFDMSDS